MNVTVGSGVNKVSTFAGDKEATSVAAVGENVEAEVVATTVYTLSGTEIPAFQKGVNVVRTRYSDGSVKVKKVLVK